MLLVRAAIAVTIRKYLRSIHPAYQPIEISKMALRLRRVQAWPRGPISQQSDCSIVTPRNCPFRRAMNRRPHLWQALRPL